MPPKNFVKISTSRAPKRVIGIGSFCVSNEIKANFLLQVGQISRTGIMSLANSRGLALRLTLGRRPQTCLNLLGHCRKCRGPVRGRKLHPVILGRVVRSCEIYCTSGAFTPDGVGHGGGWRWTITNERAKSLTGNNLGTFGGEFFT